MAWMVGGNRQLKFIIVKQRSFAGHFKIAEAVFRVIRWMKCGVHSSPCVMGRWLSSEEFQELINNSRNPREFRQTRLASCNNFWELEIFLWSHKSNYDNKDVWTVSAENSRSHQNEKSPKIILPFPTERESREHEERFAQKRHKANSRVIVALRYEQFQLVFTADDGDIVAMWFARRLENRGIPKKNWNTFRFMWTTRARAMRKQSGLVRLRFSKWATFFRLFSCAILGMFEKKPTRDLAFNCRLLIWIMVRTYKSITSDGSGPVEAGWPCGSTRK